MADTASENGSLIRSLSTDGLPLSFSLPPSVCRDRLLPRQEELLLYLLTARYRSSKQVNKAAIKRDTH